MPVHSASNSQKIADVLEEVVNKGWHVLAVSELLFDSAPPPGLFDSDMLSEDPVKVRHLTILREHDDHFHLLIVTLAKPDLDLTTHSLTDDLILAYQKHAMDEQATVTVSGTA